MSCKLQVFLIRVVSVWSYEFSADCVILFKSYRGQTNLGMGEPKNPVRGGRAGKKIFEIYHKESSISKEDDNYFNRATIVVVFL